MTVRDTLGVDEVGVVQGEGAPSNLPVVILGVSIAGQKVDTKKINTNDSKFKSTTTNNEQEDQSFM